MHNGISYEDEELSVPQLQANTFGHAASSQQISLNPQQDVFAGWNKPLTDIGRTHFVGIGGAGMSVLAQMLHEAGLPVTGSDQRSNQQTHKLERLGIPVMIGQDPGNVKTAQTVVWSSAIKPDNPEIIAASQQGIRLAHRSDILALLLSSRVGVTVAGAHGKSTTSALLAHILRVAGSGSTADPSYAIGASIQSPEGALDGGHLGQGRVLVAEADESDGSFEKYHPSIAVITNVEADHLDHYGTAERFFQAFAQHAQHAQKQVVICGDDSGSRKLLQTLRKDCSAQVVVYTTASESEIDDAGWDVWAQVVRITSERESSGSGSEHCMLEFPAQLLNQLNFDAQEDTVPVTLAIPGLHNARNGAAAIITAALLGVEPRAAATAASSFLGASRRFELKGQVGGVSVIDDYAHHPTEIQALIAATRRRYPEACIHVLFQPHLFSRTQIFAQAFAQALSAADDVIVTEVYPARERASDFPGVGEQTVVKAYRDSLAEQQQGKQASAMHMEAVADKAIAARKLAGRANSGDVILTVGAGDITQMGSVILEELETQFDVNTSSFGGSTSK